VLLIERLKAMYSQLWAHIAYRPQGFWHDSGPCARCGSRVFYVVDDEKLFLVVQCGMCRDRKAADDESEDEGDEEDFTGDDIAEF
jgi:hypothetical protein